MPLRSPRLAVLDMAGTTIAATDEVPAALTSAFLESGVILPASAIPLVRGRSKREAVRQLVQQHGQRASDTDSLSEIILTAFRRILRQRFAAGVSAIAGAENAMSWLRARGCAVVLTTGFDREIADLLLRTLGWGQDLVNGVVSADDVAHGRPAPDTVLRAMELASVPDPLDVAVVGDTSADLQAAAAAGAGWIIGVLSGAHDRDRLAAYPHTVLLPSVAALPSWLEADA